MLPSLLMWQVIALVKSSPLNLSHSLKVRQHGVKSILFLLQTSCLKVWESKGGEKLQRQVKSYLFLPTRCPSSRVFLETLMFLKGHKHPGV